jgi:ABC-2 type transport system ATP-binding protein
MKDMLRNLIKPRKKIITALDDITLTIKSGEFVAYAGANGAGKSTTMKLLSGMLVPKEGNIQVLGMSPQKDRIALMHRMGVLFGNRTELWWDHPISQSFEWKRVVWGIPKQQFKKTRNMVVELLEIGNFINTFARELSLGQRMRADLALMLLHSPELILLDEPTLGLDVLAKRNMIDFLKKINHERGVTVVVTSHDMDDLEEMAERIILLSKGNIAFDGSFENLRLHTGATKRIDLTTESIVAPNITRAHHIESSGHIHKYEVKSGTDISELLAEISCCKDIIDVETGQSPIEEVIANLYRSWDCA